MREILRELNTISGLRGSAVVMSDGVVMAAELSSGTDADSFSALVSSLVAQMGRSLPKVGLGNTKRALITASRGAFALTDLGGAWLVSELEADVDPGVFQIDIESAAGRLRRQMRPKGDPNSPAARAAAAAPAAIPAS